MNVRPETIKFLEKNIGSKLSDIDLSDNFFDLTKQRRKKAKLSKWDYKLESFYIVKKTINKMKRQPTEWEQIFASHVSDKGLISKIYK